ncbi:MAG: SBBP repeat-containing protein, partial [Myxococcales bacterium]|nr:SBBP repeat-containing protein [Myxococcales bacterium]
APPVITGSNPASPSASSTTPQLLGTTSEANVTVRLYKTASCLDAAVASGTATASGGGGAFTITASVPANSATTFYGRAIDAAGNQSACGNGFTYVHDGQGPPAPVLTAFAPTSPSTTTAGAEVSGTEGDPTSRVFVYASANCTGAAVNPSGQIATASVFTVPFTPVTLGCTPVSAKAFDPAGNASACSNSLTFTHYGCAQCACAANDWLRTFGTTGDDYGAAVALDYNNNSYEVGTTTGALLGQSSAGQADAYVVKRSSTGVFIWARQLGTSLYDAAQSVVTDPSGNVYVAGYTEGDINGSGTPVAACTPGGTGRCSDVWVARYQANGTRDWLVRWGSNRRESAPDMAWDAKNSRVLVLVGSGDPVYGNGQSPIVLAVTPATGAIAELWSYVDDTQNKNPSGLGVDASGNVYVHGRAQWSITGALSTTGSGGNGVLYVYKLSQTGVVTWLQHWGSDDHDIAYDVTADASGNVYAVGYLQGAPVGTGAVGGYRGADATIWNGWGDAALVKLSSAGAQQWARSFGTARNDLASAVWLYNGLVYVSGASAGNPATGGNTSLYGGTDIFVAAFGTDGSVPANSVRIFGSAGDDGVGRSVLSGGVWLLPGTSTAAWTGMSQDACGYGGGAEAFLGRFCVGTGGPSPL